MGKTGCDNNHDNKNPKLFKAYVRGATLTIPRHYYM